MSITRARTSSVAQGPSTKKTLLGGNDVILGGSYDAIGTTTVGSGGQATVSFTSIPGTYKHLQVRISGNSSGADNASFVFNSDTGNNYTRHRLVGNGSAAQAAGGGGLPAWYVFSSGGFPSTSNCFGASIVDILDYANTNKYKTGRAINGQDNNSTGAVEFTSGLWLNTAAITRIDITAFAGSWTQYTQISLYGIK
jgi:hypothetical protein